MSNTAVDILVCPPELRVDAIALVLCDLAPSQRRDIGRDIVRHADTNHDVSRALYVAVRESQLCGAAWGQFQPGNTAVFWSPRLDAGESVSPTAERLTAAVVDALDAAGVAMTQVLLPARDAPDAALVEAAGFHYLTDLVYLTCERARFPIEPHVSTDLRFEPYDESQRQRLTALAERTYEDTLDCRELGGQRQMDDVIDGYMATGKFRPANWFFVRARFADHDGDTDVGLLLLAEYPDSNHIELIYMGLIPPARGRSWGRQIVQHAQWTARGANCKRIVCAVDAANLPGLAVYRDTHFEIWDRRSIFLRFLKQPE